MTFVNRDCIFKIETNGEINRSLPERLFEQYFNDKNYWVVDFASGYNLHKVNDLISNDMLERIRHGDLHLLLCNIAEAMAEDLFYIHKLIEDLQIPKNKVTYVTGAYDTDITGITTVVVMVFEALNFTLNSPLKRTKFVKRFILPNRRWRIHRPALIAMLAAKNLLSHGFISMRNYGDGNSWKTSSGKIIESFPSLTPHKKLIESLPDLRIDKNEFNQPCPDEMNRKYYEKSFFSVVSETNYFKGQSRFLTEKTFRSIDYEIPFILVSRPHSLSLLREKGYKTFSPYFNEDYDLEEDDNKRLVMIADEIERLCKLPEKELYRIIDKLKPICQHNRQVQRSKQYPNDYIWRIL